MGSRLHSRPWPAFGMRIYEISVNFVRPDPKFGAKLSINWENEHFLTSTSGLERSLCP